MTKKEKIITFVITFVSVVALILLDQVTKILVENNVNKPITIINNFFYIEKVYNKGAAWGVGENNTLLLACISLIGASVATYFAANNDYKKKPVFSISLVLIIAGAIGNMIDRFMTVFGIRQGVIDMLSFRFGSYHYPVFNIADVLLVVGVIVLAIDIIFLEERRQKCKKNT